MAENITPAADRQLRLLNQQTNPTSAHGQNVGDYNLASELVGRGFIEDCDPGFRITQAGQDHLRKIDEESA